MMSRGSSVAERRAHTAKVAGSNPAPATTSCRCKGYYHDYTCSDKNMIFWDGVTDGKIPVDPSFEEVRDQIELLRANGKIP